MREDVTGILPGFIADGRHEYLCVGFNLLGDYCWRQNMTSLFTIRHSEGSSVVLDNIGLFTIPGSPWVPFTSFLRM